MLTSHARTRAQQRGISPEDLDVILESGTTMRPGLHVLRDRDAEREIRSCKRRIQQLERLRRAAVVQDGGDVVTVYHLSGKAGRRSIRRAGTRMRGNGNGRRRHV